jgi:predicted dehydrogenase
MRRDADKAADYAKRHGVPKFYTNADDLIADPEVDAVYIATPPDTHLYYGRKVAEAGKPCCIEKPLAPSYAESLAISNAFKERGLPLFSSYYRRSLPRFLQVKEWLDQGAIGTVRHIRWHLCKPPSPTDLDGGYNWRTDPQVAPGGYFDDLASHGLDLFVYFLGPVERAYGISTNQQGLYGAKDAITSCWLHTNGVTGEGSWNFGSGTREDKVEILGSGGCVEFSIFNEGDIVLKNNKGEIRLFIENPLHVQQYHVANIREHLLGNRLHPSTGETAAHTSWFMDRILDRI